MKKHQCCRCKRHVSEVFEIARKSGRRRNYCTDCIETMKRKGASLDVVGPGADERRRTRRGAMNAGERR